MWGLLIVHAASAQAKKPNIVMLRTDDTGWGDSGAYSGGGASLGHPIPNMDRMAKEGAMLTSWYGQVSCTSGRGSFMTGRIPIRSALSIVSTNRSSSTLASSVTRMVLRTSWCRIYHPDNPVPLLTTESLISSVEPTE